MYYEINIAKQNHSGNYEHYFATAPRSITNKTRLKEVVLDLKEKFTFVIMNKIDILCQKEMAI